MNKTIRRVVLSSLLAAPLPLVAAELPASQIPSAEVPLKVEIVVSRYQGEKKISSIPYTLAVVAAAGGRGEPARLRMGVDVPVPRSVATEGTAPQTSYTYRSVGTNIDCAARALEGGLFKLDLTVADTAVFVPEKDGGSAAQSRVSGVPAFRTFTSNFNLLLKSGQSAQHTAATDPVSGEVLRIDVTLTVLK